MAAQRQFSADSQLIAMDDQCFHPVNPEQHTNGLFINIVDLFDAGISGLIGYEGRCPFGADIVSGDGLSDLMRTNLAFFGTGRRQ
jgi:hypothetical protein